MLPNVARGKGIYIKPTLLGKFLGIIFKPPQLDILLNLKGGASIKYRVPSGMMRSGFFISPLIRNTEDFVFLATGNQYNIKNNIVDSFIITPSYGGSIFWSATYSLTLKEYRGEIVSTLPENFFDTISDSIPEGYGEARLSSCDGVIDEVNGIYPTQKVQSLSGMLSVRGWLAVSAKDGIVPEDIFITLKNINGETKYIRTRRPQRNDVKAYYNQPEMPDVGFNAMIDVAALNGKYILGLSRIYDGKFEQCNQFNISVDIVGEK